MFDLLAAWGVTTAFGLVFKPILEELAKGAAADFAKDFLTDSLKSVFRREKDPALHDLAVAAGRALKEFLQFFQQELEDSGLAEAEIATFTRPLGGFVERPEVRALLGSPLTADPPVLDTRALAAAWRGRDPALPSLPDDFSWDRLGRRYGSRAAAIRQESSALREILSAQDLSATRRAAEEVAGVVPGFDLRAYRDAMRERYGTLKLESLDTSGYAYNDVKLWRVFIPQTVRESAEFLPQVFELPKEHLRRLRESGQLGVDERDGESPDALEERRRAFLSQAPRSVLEVVADPTLPHLVVLGDPGSGKSSLLQYLVLRWVEEDQSERPLPVPILIELREYARQRRGGWTQSFLDFLHEGSGLSCHLNRLELDRRLRDGRVYLLFDGLDEVFDPELRAEVTGDIHRFSNDYPGARLVVTSRVIGYRAQALRDAGFRHFLLQDLEAEQIAEFLRRWHVDTYDNLAEREQKRQRLEWAIVESAAIRELAGNPLLLTMMAILNRHQDLPRQRAELYQQCARLLLQQWKVDQAIHQALEKGLAADPRLAGVFVDLEDKQALLRSVAREMQTAPAGKAGNLITGDQLEEVLRKALKRQVPTSTLSDRLPLLAPSR